MSLQGNEAKSPFKQHEEERSNFSIGDTSFKTATSFKSRSPLLRVLVGVVLLLVVLLTILAALYIALQKKRYVVVVPKYTEEQSNLCNTKECVQIAASELKYVACK